jgi:hypothetical protein
MCSPLRSLRSAGKDQSIEGAGDDQGRHRVRPSNIDQDAGHAHLAHRAEGALLRVGLGHEALYFGTMHLGTIVPTRSKRFYSPAECLEAALRALGIS